MGKRALLPARQLETPSEAAAGAGVPKDTPKPPEAAQKPAQERIAALAEGSVFFDGAWSVVGADGQPAEDGAGLLYWMTVAAAAERLTDTEEAGQIAAANPKRAGMLVERIGKREGQILAGIDRLLPIYGEEYRAARAMYQTAEAEGLEEVAAEQAEIMELTLGRGRGLKALKADLTATVEGEVK